MGVVGFLCAGSQSLAVPCNPQPAPQPLVQIRAALMTSPWQLQRLSKVQPDPPREQGRMVHFVPMSGQRKGTKHLCNAVFSWAGSNEHGALVREAEIPAGASKLLASAQGWSSHVLCMVPQCPFFGLHFRSTFSSSSPSKTKLRRHFSCEENTD